MNNSHNLHGEPTVDVRRCRVCECVCVCVSGTAEGHQSVGCKTALITRERACPASLVQWRAKAVSLERICNGPHKLSQVMSLMAHPHTNTHTCTLGEMGQRLAWPGPGQPLCAVARCNELSARGQWSVNKLPVNSLLCPLPPLRIPLLPLALPCSRILLKSRAKWVNSQPLEVP